jgi:hypothetical protein
MEAALKACIAKKTRKFEFPDKRIVNNSYTHEISKLAEVGGLNQLIDATSQINGIFAANWSVVRDWKIGSRYEVQSARTARDLYNAITQRRNGIMSWIRNHW